MDRRSLLRRSGAVGLAALGTGCGTILGSEGGDSTGTVETSVRTSDRPPEGDEYETVVDVVDAGGDPTGEEVVDDVLADRTGDDVLLYFPEGEYRLGDRFTLRSFSNLALVGEGATIVPRDGYSGYMLDLGRSDEATGLRVEGLRFDFRSRDTGARALNVHVDDGLRVRDVAAVGVQDTDQTVARFGVTSTGGSGVVERLRLPDGGAPDTASTGCLVPPRNVGKLEFLDCHFGGFPDNGLYASPSEGPVRVVGGLYENSGVANVRIGDRAVVRNVVVRCDDASRGFPNMRGIRVDAGQGARIEDSTVLLGEVTGSDGAVVLSRAAGSTDVIDTRIQIDVDEVAGLLAKAPESSSAVAGGTALRCRHVTVSGSSSGGQAVAVSGRDGCLFEDVAVCQSGADRDGLYVGDSTGGLIRNSAISVTDRPLVFEDAEVGTDAVDTDLSVGDCRELGGADCPVPDAVWPYAGTDCTVDTPELQRAITDWATGAITTPVLAAVVRAWAAG